MKTHRNTKKWRKGKVIHHPKQMIATQHTELDLRPDWQVCAEAGNLLFLHMKMSRALTTRLYSLISRVCMSVPLKQIGKKVPSDGLSGVS